MPRRLFPPAGAAVSCLAFLALSHCILSALGWDLGPLMTEVPVGGRDEALDALTQPLAEMTLLSYVSTAGSYFRPESTNATPDGWRRELTIDPGLSVGFGMRAIVFIEEGDSNRTVVTFRGTDLNVTTVGGQADLCMDYLAAAEPLPGYCSNFTAKQIDYIHAVRELLSLAAWQRPGQQVLFTGHSLGCALAVIAQALLDGSKAACFAQAAVSADYWGERQLGGTPGDVFVLSDSQDPVAVMSEQREQLRGKWACWWGSKEFPACTHCGHSAPGLDVVLDSLHSGLSAGATSVDTAPRDDCDSCFEAKHTFGHYLGIISHDEEASYGCRLLESATVHKTIAAEPGSSSAGAAWFPYFGVTSMATLFAPCLAVLLMFRPLQLQLQHLLYYTNTILYGILCI